MAGIFINYRREDTSGEANHLADELIERVGRRRVFIDIDTIGPGVDFTKSIDSALTKAAVVLVLIGDRWLSVTDSQGRRRLDVEGDFVVLEIAKALERPDVTVVPVLVEGTPMPTEAQLPPAIAGLAKRNALELTSKRWRYDLEQILALVPGRGPAATVRGAPTWAKVAIPAVIAAALAALIVIAVGGGSSDGGAQSPDAQRSVLAPATVPPAVDLCSQQLERAVDGTVGPIECDGGKLNQLAWEEFAPAKPVTLGLGPNATIPQVQDALCLDLQNPGIGTNPKTDELYDLAELYYGWKFGIVPTAADC
jgi:hypothetical protein